MVSTSADDSDLDSVVVMSAMSGMPGASDNRPVLWVPSSEAIEDVYIIAGVQVVDSTLSVDFESVLVHLDIDRTPVDVILAAVFVDDTLVLGTAASLLSGKVDQGSRGGDDGTLVLDGIFVQLSHARVSLEVDLVHIETSLGEHLEVFSAVSGEAVSMRWQALPDGGKLTAIGR